MSHRKRIKLACVAILVLLLTAAMAPAAVAQDVGIGPPPADTGDDGDGSGGGTDPILPGNGNGNGGGTDPILPGNGNGNGGGTDPILPGNGNGGMNGDKDGDMMMAPVNWPPPNAIVRHAATPIQISSLEGGLQVYFIGADGATHGPLLASLSKLAEMHPDGAAVELFSGTNPGTGKPVTIQYLPDAMLLHVNTFYADKPPHDYNKAYIFTVDADHSVNHERW
ncbi:MAG: hypothetical protein F4Y42_07215 [Caldilineaceae bacterium SB0664_bin_27]|uniref:Uncharacterized protein n=1 Tax=Caldilineaceae bacterium SB0664_bin_27 TaxID=2605260 RepID=A0A6B0YUV3_9CHLR|nr:hypothetical protein [Caldilineaceae bacterium SB0664_bin_27]